MKATDFNGVRHLTPEYESDKLIIIKLARILHSLGQGYRCTEHADEGVLMIEYDVDRFQELLDSFQKHKVLGNLI